jgi:hypothetical protein
MTPRGGRRRSPDAHPRDRLRVVSAAGQPGEKRRRQGELITTIGWARFRLVTAGPNGAGQLATRPQAHHQVREVAGPGSTRAGPSSRRPPWTARSPGGASRSSATGRGGGRRPSLTRLQGPRLPRRPPGRWPVQRRSEATCASCASEPVERLGRFGETHGDRKVVGGGAIPLAPTTDGFLNHRLRSSVGPAPRPSVHLVVQLGSRFGTTSHPAARPA